ncbi:MULTISPECIES: thioredoxin domain-containing protein [Actinosynnema]|uniref:DsbA family protein n=1 Tax=Actinosynnema TaxID=40566 RepID=UPI0020A3F314|nr:thioredoxin domain-containing protein [Actinosynnema pretiosum]MCP2092187.1 Protein-disulfide isomerase [Actinosynnema pretiosum]
MSRTPQPRKSNPVTAKRGPSLNVVLTGIVVLVAALVIGGVLVVNRSSGDGSADLARLLPADAHTLSEVEGNRVTLVEFLDYQCPACHSYYSGITEQLEEDYRGRITFATRNFPLDVHPLAPLAARATEAAGEQDKHTEMYHALYGGFDEWAVTGQATASDETAARAVFERYAQEIGLDVDRFRADLDSDAVEAAVDRDVADGKALGVTGTPTFFVNGERFEPAGQTLEAVGAELRAALDEALAG